MELVILGLKNKQTGTLSIYDGSNYKSIKKIPFELNTEIKGTVQPFPFRHFSSLSEGDVMYETHTRIYLLIESDLTPKELEKMLGGSLMSYTFENRTFKVLSEFKTPFEYSYQQLLKYGSALGDYNMTTWIIHEQAQTAKEFDCMCKMLKNRLESKDNLKYPLDLSLDTYTLQYITFLVEFDGKHKMTFGRSGSISITQEDLENTELSTKGYLFLLRKLYLTTPLIHYPKFNIEFYKEFIEKEPLLEKSFLDAVAESDDSKRRNIIGALISRNFDMEYLYERFYNLKINASHENYYFEDRPEHYIDIVQIKDYKPLIETYDPYAGYCCYDCDGYDIDPDEKSYTYEVDEQVNMLEYLLRNWDSLLTEKSAHLFTSWDKDIFVRYAKKHEDSLFITHLLNLK